MKRFYFPVILFCLLTFGLSNNSFAQIQINDTVTPYQMVENFVGNGIVFENVSYTGADIASGIFTNTDSTNLGFDSGIFLTSGAGYYIPGPNGPGSCTAGTWNNLPGDDLLTAIGGVTTHDASILEFDFIPDGDTICFKYVFGSEEYNDYVNSGANDIFCAFITGPKPDSGTYINKNIAIIPDSSPEIPIAINTVNNGHVNCDVIPTGPCTNCEYFMDNTSGASLEYDGLTVVLTALQEVVPNEVYHLKIAIADGGDGVLDCGVFLEESSFQSLTSAEFYSFRFDTINNPGLSENIIGYFSNDSVFLDVPFGYGLTNLIASFALSSGAETFVDGLLQESGITSNDYPNHIYYNVIGADNYEKEWVVIVKSHQNQILDFSFEVDNNPYLNEDITGLFFGDSIQMNVPYGIDKDSLIATFYLSDYASAFVDGNMQYSDSTANDFTDDLVYSIEAENGNINEYMIYTMYPENEIEFFFFDDAYNPTLNEDVIGILTDSTVDMHVPVGTDISSLISTFVLSVESQAYVNDFLQENLVTANNFTNPVTYKVIAQSGDVKNWLVTVHLGTGYSDEKETSFSIYPNPANSILYINAKTEGSINLIDPEGKALKQFNWKEGHHQIDISKLPQGIYYLEFRTGENAFSRKVIIAR